MNQIFYTDAHTVHDSKLSLSLLLLAVHTTIFCITKFSKSTAMSTYLIHYRYLDTFKMAKVTKLICFQLSLQNLPAPLYQYTISCNHWNFATSLSPAKALQNLLGPLVFLHKVTLPVSIIACWFHQPLYHHCLIHSGHYGGTQHRTGSMVN